MFKDTRTIREALWHQKLAKASWFIFAALNYDCRNRRTELKLVWLEPSGHDNCEYVKASITFGHFIKSLMRDEISLCVLSGVLASETSARAPDGITGNCQSHTILVAKKKKSGALADES